MNVKTTEQISFQIILREKFILRNSSEKPISNETHLFNINQSHLYHKKNSPPLSPQPLIRINFVTPREHPLFDYYAVPDTNLIKDYIYHPVVTAKEEEEKKKKKKKTIPSSDQVDNIICSLTWRPIGLLIEKLLKNQQLDLDKDKEGKFFSDDKYPLFIYNGTMCSLEITISTQGQIPPSGVFITGNKTCCVVNIDDTGPDGEFIPKPQYTRSHIDKIEKALLSVYRNCLQHILKPLLHDSTQALAYKTFFYTTQSQGPIKFLNQVSGGGDTTTKKPPLHNNELYIDLRDQFEDIVDYSSKHYHLTIGKYRFLMQNYSDVTYYHNLRQEKSRALFEKKLYGFTTLHVKTIDGKPPVTIIYFIPLPDSRNPLYEGPLVSLTLGTETSHLEEFVLSDSLYYRDTVEEEEAFPPPPSSSSSSPQFPLLNKRRLQISFTRSRIDQVADISGKKITTTQTKSNIRTTRKSTGGTGQTTPKASETDNPFILGRDEPLASQLIPLSTAESLFTQSLDEFMRPVEDFVRRYLIDIALVYNPLMTTHEALFTEKRLSRSFKSTRLDFLVAHHRHQNRGTLADFIDLVRLYGYLYIFYRIIPITTASAWLDKSYKKYLSLFLQASLLFCERMITLAADGGQTLNAEKNLRSGMAEPTSLSPDELRQYRRATSERLYNYTIKEFRRQYDSLFVQHSAGKGPFHYIRWRKIGEKTYRILPYPAALQEADSIQLLVDLDYYALRRLFIHPKRAPLSDSERRREIKCYEAMRENRAEGFPHTYRLMKQVKTGYFIASKPEAILTSTVWSSDFSEEERLLSFIDIFYILYHTTHTKDGVEYYLQHRDLGQNNILFDNRARRIILTDLGNSKIVELPSDKQPRLSKKDITNITNKFNLDLINNDRRISSEIEFFIHKKNLL